MKTYGVVEWELPSINHCITDEKRVVSNQEVKKSGNLKGKGVHILDMPEDLWNELSQSDWRRCQVIWDQEEYARACENHHLS